MKLILTIKKIVSGIYKVGGFDLHIVKILIEINNKLI
jgi:hypothetical protein